MEIRAQMSLDRRQAFIMRPPLHLSRRNAGQMGASFLRILRYWHRTLEEGDMTSRAAGLYACVRIVISLISLVCKTDVFGAMLSRGVASGVEALGCLSVFYVVARVFLATQPPHDAPSPAHSTLPPG
jgi:hypothetical protein